MSPSGGEPTPAGGARLMVTCPGCGLVHQLPPIAMPATVVAAQVSKPDARLNRAPELEDATPTQGQTIDSRQAPTERIENRKRSDG